MWLIHSKTLEPCEFSNSKKYPDYAILSHTWEQQEVTFSELLHQPLAKRGIGETQGVDKVLRCAKQARKDGIEYFWIDTCCIQKTSSAELSEAINSMFNWYRNAKCCYAYLADVPPRRHQSPNHRRALPDNLWFEAFRKSRWFRRGWTLQELIAPKNLIIFSDAWTTVGTKAELAKTLSSITRIPKTVLVEGDVFGQSVACRMSWASNRETTRPEDMAYCLLGIFNITMPLLYGEGIYAFHRLQQEIVKVTDDETIFAWKAKSSTPSTWRSLFAHDPTEFASSSNLIPHRHTNAADYETTMNKDLRIKLPLVPRTTEEDGWDSGTEYVAVLSCHVDTALSNTPIGICVKRIREGDYIRVDVDRYITLSPQTTTAPGTERVLVSVRQRLDYSPWTSCNNCFRIRGMWIKNASPSAKLKDVQTTCQWDAMKSIITFSESEMRFGKTQCVSCVFSTGQAQSKIRLNFNPRAAYSESCCEYSLDSADPFHAYQVRSFIRVMDHEAILVVNIEAW